MSPIKRILITMSNQMELNHIRSFVVLAKELHYRRAADRLFISQPGLSKRIRQLESALESQLFKRHTRSVELTFSGQYLLSEAQSILDQVEGIKSQIRLIEKGSQGEVRIGFVGSAMQGVIPDLVMKSNTLHPDIHFTLEEMSIVNQLEDIRNNHLDIGFVRQDKVPTGLSIRPVYEESFALVLPKDHPVDQESFEGLSQFKDESFILFSSDYSSTYYYNQIMSIFDNAGFDPIISNRSINANIIFKLVGNGFGIAIVPKSLAQDYNLPIKLIELSDIPQRAVLSVVWKKKQYSNLVKNVLDIIIDN